MSSVEMNRLLTEMKIAAAQARGVEQPLEQNGASQTSFGDVLSDAINKVNDLQKESGSLQRKFELNDPNVDLPDVMIAMQKSRVAFTAMNEVRNKLVSAYKDVMSMPI